MDGRMDALFTNILALPSDRLHSLILFSSSMSGTIRPQELADFYRAPSPGDALVEIAPISAGPSPVSLTNQNPWMYHMTRSPGRRKAAFLSTLWMFWNILPSNWRASPLPWQQTKTLPVFPVIFTVYQRSGFQRMTNFHPKFQVYVLSNVKPRITKRKRSISN